MEWEENERAWAREDDVGVGGWRQPSVLILIENASMKVYPVHRLSVYRWRRQIKPIYKRAKPWRRSTESASAPANVPGDPGNQGVIQFDTPTHA